MIKIYLFLLCLFNYAFTQDEQYDFDETENILSYGTKTFQINFSEETKYKEYFKFILETKNEDINPIILISDRDNTCKDYRLYMGVQAYDPIYIFLKKGQISNNIIYICVKTKENSDSIQYKIKLSNEDKAQIPYNSQASYYISDKNIESMKFAFISGNESYNSDSSVTIWLRGNNIERPRINSFSEEIYDSAYVYYGQYSNNNLEVEVKSKVGDYVTIGSTIISQKKSPKLKENANEIMVASNEEEVCLPITFENKVYFAYNWQDIYKKSRSLL